MVVMALSAFPRGFFAIAVIVRFSIPLMRSPILHRTMSHLESPDV